MTTSVYVQPDIHKLFICPAPLLWNVCVTYLYLYTNQKRYLFTNKNLYLLIKNVWELEAKARDVLEVKRR